MASESKAAEKSTNHPLLNYPFSNLFFLAIGAVGESAVVSSPKRQRKQSVEYISLTTHVGQHGVQPVPVTWGADGPEKRGPIICAQTNETGRNAIGAHSGSYSIYKALSVAAGALDPTYVPNFTNTAPAVQLGPHPSWVGAKKIVTLDPYGHIPTKVFSSFYEKGYDIRPTIAVTKAHMDVPEVTNNLKAGKLQADGHVLLANGQLHVTKAAVEPVWYLPGVAERFGCSPATLRKELFRQTNGMYPELLTRADLDIFLPPIGGLTIYIFGDPAAITDPTKKLAVRVHDECNGSDVFGSDICTCRPYLVHGIEVCVKTAQEGGAGIIVYFRKEGRALGEVTKYLVYNARKRQEGGDSAAEYFKCTENVAGVEDMRFQV